MAEYIEREKVIDELEHLHEDAELSYLGVYDCIESVPTADVVPVVRCKDCKNYEYMSSNNQYFCNKFGGYVTKNDYCSRCERRCEE